MATVCDACGHRDNEVKGGSGIEPKGTCIKLKLTKEEDLSRDVLKVSFVLSLQSRSPGMFSKYVLSCHYNFVVQGCSQGTFCLFTTISYSRDVLKVHSVLSLQSRSPEMFSRYILSCHYNLVVQGCSQGTFCLVTTIS